MKFEKSKYTLYVGEKKKLKVLNYVKKAKYKSSKKSVATVDSKGHVTAKKAGKTVIRVSINGYTSKCKVTVKNVKINKKSIVIAAGLTDSLYLTNNFKAKWKSSDESVVTVTSTGTIKAKAAGTAVITAKRKGKKYKCNITVYKNEISSGKTFKVTGSDNILLTLKKVERSGDTYKAYVHASYVGGTVTSVDNLNISVCDGSKPIFTKTVTHLDGDEYIITFSGSELKNAETDLTGVAPALWAKGNFKYIKYI